jgi:Glycosyltransferase 61
MTATTWEGDLVFAVSDDDLITMFVSLGDSAEFSQLQKLAAVRSLGSKLSLSPFPTLRKLQDVITALTQADSADPLSCALHDPSYRCDFLLHRAQTTPGHTHSPYGLLARQCHLRDELAAARRVFIWKSAPPDAEADVRRLVTALRHHGPNMLLWVREADENHRSGLVENARDGLLFGYLDRFACHEETGSVDVRGWLTLCHNAAVAADFLRRCGEWSHLRPNEAREWRPDPAVTLEETWLEEVAEEIHFEQERLTDLPSGPVLLGNGFDDAQRQSLAHHPGSAGIRNAVLRDVIMASASSSLLVKEGRKVHETHRGGMNMEQFRQARANLNMMRWEGSRKLAVLGYNRAVPMRHYGHYHWMMESLVSLDLAVQRFGADRCVLVLPRLHPRCEETLNLLGLASLPRIIVDINTGYYFREACYIEYLGSVNAFHLCPGLMGTFDRMAAAVQPTHRTPKRIYVARTDSATRRMINEEEVQTLMRAHGFACVVLSDMTIGEQINLFRGADIIVGPHGAGLTNLVFCRPGTAVLELFMSSYLNMCMARIAQTRQLNYRAEAFENSENSPVYERRWAVDIGQLAAALQQLL